MSFFGDLIGGFTGSTARRLARQQRADINANTAGARGAIQAGGQEARGYFDNYREQGGRAHGMYGDTLGVNGLAARDTAQGVYTSDPILGKLREMDAKKAGWAFNARGGYGSGAHALADSRANLEGYGNWQNRLAQAGQEGQAAAGATAGIAQREGEGLANAYQANSGQIAGTYDAERQAANALTQNVIGLGGLALSAYTGMPIGGMGARSSTQGGTMANGGFTTTTTPTPQGAFSRFGNYLGGYFS